MDALSTAIESLSVAVGSVVNLDEFAPLLLPNELADPEVETVRGTFSFTAVEPGTLRGVDDVYARIKAAPPPQGTRPPTPRQLIASVLYARGAGAHGLLVDAEQLNARSEAVARSLDAVISVVLKDEHIRGRLRERWGFRAADAPDDQSYFASLDAQGAEFLVIPFLVDRFSSALSGVDLPKGEAEWKVLGRKVAADIHRLLSRSHYLYRLTAFLNSPPLEQSVLELGTHQERETSVDVVMAIVTDEMIADVYRRGVQPPSLPLGLSRVNSAVCVDFSVTASATSAASEAAAQDAIEVARKIVDVLRILRMEDLGIGYAHIAGLDVETPMLAPGSLWNYQEAGAAFTPRRGYFGTPDRDPLSSSALEALSSHAARHIGGIDVRGFGVAIRRFRDMCERYWPGDPESLLDATIALEALFMSDQDTKELRHRLSLRVARLLV